METLNCTKREISEGNQMFLNRESSIEVSLQLLSPEKEAKCVRNVTLYFQDMEQNQDSMLINITMACKSMKPGPWILEILELGIENPYIYKLKFYLLDLQNVDNLKEQLGGVSRLWELEHFAVLKENTLFDFQNYENQDKQDFQDMVQTLPVENFGVPDIIEKKKFNQGIGWLNDWLICNRGFPSFVTLCFTAILLYVWRYRMSQHLVLFFLLSLIFLAVLQITLFMTLCV